MAIGPVQLIVLGFSDLRRLARWAADCRVGRRPAAGTSFPLLVPNATLIDLGWTGGDRALPRGASAPATDLYMTALQRDLGPMLYAVGEVLRRAWAACARRSSKMTSSRTHSRRRIRAP